MGQFIWACYSKVTSLTCLVVDNLVDLVRDSLLCLAVSLMSVSWD